MGQAETLSQYVKRVMRQKGLTLRDVERNSGEQITNSYIGRILKGKVANLTVETIIALARGLEVDPYDIFAASYGQQPPNSSDQPNPLVLIDTLQKLILEPQLMELLQEWVRLSPDEQTHVLQSIKYLNKSKAQKRTRKR